MLVRRHEEYAKFCVDYFGSDRFPGYSTRSPSKSIPNVLTYTCCCDAPRSSHRLGFAGLCSTWSSQSCYKAGGDTDQDQEGSQFICIQTVREAIEALKDADFRIAMFHHPPEWLVEPERDRLRMSDSLYASFDMILTGHTHKAQKLYVPPQQGLRAYRSPAGSLFDSWGRCNAFNLMELCLEKPAGSSDGCNVGQCSRSMGPECSDCRRGT